MSPASLVSSVEWAQSALMELEHLAAAEAKVLDKEAYTNPAVCDTAGGPDHSYRGALADTSSDASDTSDAYAHPALSESDLAEIRRLREIEGLEGRDLVTR